jgi:hypothetical protein
MAKTSDILRETLAQFGPNGEHWTQDTFARDKEGRGVWRRSEHACQWCSMGALFCVLDRHNEKYTSRAGEFLYQAMGEPAPIFNDAPGRTFSDVKAAFEKAISLAEADEVQA